MTLQPISDSLKRTRYNNYIFTMTHKNIMFEMIWVALKVTTDCFVSSIKSFNISWIAWKCRNENIKSRPKPFVCWIEPVTLYPARQVTCYRIGFFLTLDSTFWNRLAMLCVIAFIKFAFDYGTTRAVVLNCRNTIAFKNSLHAFCYNWEHILYTITFKFSFKQCRYLLHFLIPHFHFCTAVWAII